MAAFPSLHTQAEELIYQSAITAAIARPARVLTKTSVEAFRIPSLADNVNSLIITHRALHDAAHIQVDEMAVQSEMKIIRKEVLAIIDAVIGLEGGDTSRGIVEAFQRGIIDIPFAPSVHNRGEVMCVRAANKAVRFLSVGSLPFDKQTKQFHAELLAERCRLEGIPDSTEH